MKNIRKLNDTTFKRLLGVKKETYNLMIAEYKNYRKKQKESFKIGGLKPKLSDELRVQLMLGYYREYRTLEHIGFDYGVSETTALRTVREVEEVLIKSNKFTIKGKKAFNKSDIDLSFVLIDVTEVPIQRPKKSK